MSYTCLNYHIVFSTKSRKQYLNDEQVQGAVKYIGGILGNHKGCLLLGNGMPNHIHLLCSLHPDNSVSEIVRTIKANSSRWIHENYHKLKTFEWQEGYSAFSVSYSGVDKVVSYIRNQQEHHRKMTFEEELLSLLKSIKYSLSRSMCLGENVPTLRGWSGVSESISGGLHHRLLYFAPPGLRTYVSVDTEIQNGIK